jgi:YHS domain-containing protein
MKSSMQVAVVVVLAILAACGGGRVESADVGGPRQLINVDKRGVALQGYDPVAYFTDHEPVKGDSAWASTYRGGTYFFASAEHKAMFDADPARYEPQFGGYCGYAASINKVSPIGVEWFEILEGRLVLQHNAKAWRLWHEDVAGNLMKADRNWPGLVRKHGKPA